MKQQVLPWYPLDNPSGTSTQVHPCTDSPLIFELQRRYWAQRNQENKGYTTVTISYRYKCCFTNDLANNKEGHSRISLICHKEGKTERPWWNDITLLSFRLSHKIFKNSYIEMIPEIIYLYGWFYAFNRHCRYTGKFYKFGLFDFLKI